MATSGDHPTPDDAKDQENARVSFEKHGVRGQQGSWRQGKAMHMRPPRFLLFVLVLMLAATVFAASAPADDDDDDGGGSSTRVVDFTFGSGTAEFPPFGTSTFDFDVESGPNGEAVAGFATLVSAFGVPFAGPATCLRVAGNRAVFEVDNQTGTMQDVVVFVGDFGPAGVGDEFNFFFIVGVADATCPAPGPTDRPPIVGDIVVGDDVPVSGGGDDDDDDDDDGGDEDGEDG
jgi:hypothetical protein